MTLTTLNSVKRFSQRREKEKENSIMRPWKDLGIVETIYEEDYNYDTNSSSDLSKSHNSSPNYSSNSLHSTVKAWSMATGSEADVFIYVQGTCFHLHKDPLTSRSTYLRRHLTAVNEFTLFPPLKITPETFALIADFCYGSDIVITPFNIAALRTAAELLKMTETSHDDSFKFENLKQITETYFRRILAVDGSEFVSIVFRCCLSLLPEAETEALMVSRCVEALSLRDDGDGDGIVSEELIGLAPEEFQIVADSMQRVTFHDVVYRIIDCYIKEHGGSMKEDQTTRICNSIDCNRLSPDLLFHAVQNPRMPLRFVVRAMLIEQLKTRRAILSTTTTTSSSAVAIQKPRQSSVDHVHPNNSSPVNTLGAILLRDAARHREEQLKATMDSTSSRIQKLERELQCMKLLLLESDKERKIDNEIDRSRSILDSVRSASFHYGMERENYSNGRIERGGRRSVSFRFGGSGSGGERVDTAAVATERLEKVTCVKEITPKSKKNIGMKLFSGLRGAFKASKHD